MQFGVLGTGMVGHAIGSKLVELGHQVMMGSRDADNPKAALWASAAGATASHGTFADAACFGEILFNCTAGVHSLEALDLAGRANLSGKILIDTANALDFSQGMPPPLAICNTDSLGEQLQRTFPDVQVVKTLNTMNCYVMVNPRLVPGDHTVFVSGNDPAAKARVSDILTWFGWQRENIIDLGDIATARGTEMLVRIWLTLWGRLQHANFNFHIVVGPKV